ncbi:hypothetical protein AB6A40_003474 [Gnathostoma spinigerum]|uniref:CWH43-like N-terminal domain-containing protein n=1 Tax=Gnathostoma spinigerum TaxID=75299 RepID=A0ABD6EAV3_9BILA
MVYHGDPDQLISVPVRWIVYTVAGLPFAALVICIALSILLHWDEATATHCGVANWLPSISAAVASYSPERYIWRVFISLHAAPRYVAAIAFRNYLLTSPLWSPSDVWWYPVACHALCAVQFAENTFLLLLTSVSSTENYLIHKISFSAFAVCAIIYMLSATWIFQFSGRNRTSPLGERSLQYKILMCWASLTALACSLYFFYRHNTYCEPGIYSFFAISEYALVLSNILFHSTLFFDFHGKRLMMSSFGSLPEYEVLNRVVAKQT